MYIGDIEVTLREAVFSVTIASAMSVAGFLISEQLEHHVNQSNLKFRQAVRISRNPDEFSTALATDVGNAFVEGHFAAVDPVRHSRLDGEWLSIHAEFQEYTRHTRTVHYTVTDSKGRTHHRTRTETYWTWDTYKTENVRSHKVDYIGTVFPFDKFNYSYIGRRHRSVDNGFRKRIEFSCLPKEFNASAFTELRKGTVSDRTTLFKDLPIDKLYDSCVESMALPVFWTMWTLLTVLAVVGFVAMENHWIEDRPSHGRKPLRKNAMCGIIRGVKENGIH